MINVPLNAKVIGTDGPSGESTCLIVNPVNQTVTHVVVKEKFVPHTEFMVPLERITESTVDTIQLDCTSAELKQMEAFIGTQFVKTDHYMPYYGTDTMMAWPYTTAEGVDLPAEYEKIPAGSLAVRKGTYVQATDGPVGKVDELLLDQESGQVTHLVLREGHLWGKKVVALPVSIVDEVKGEEVFLKVDKQAVGELPAIPVKQQDSAAGVELVFATFDSEDKSKQAMDALKQLVKKENVAILNVALLIKGEDGKASFKETEDVPAGKGALFGAITGGLVGLLAGPAGAVIGAAAGAATGGIAAHKIDMGLPNDYLKTLQDEMESGSSGVVVVVTQEWADEVSSELAELEGNVFKHALADEVVSRLTAGSDQE